MTEQELINSVQDGIGAAKKGLKSLQDLNASAGRPMAANAAMGLRGELMSWHRDALVELNNHYPELTSDVSTRGGGGR